MNLPQRLENFKNSIGEQVLLGTVIADSCLVKRCRNCGTTIQLCHSEKQKDYLEWKIKILREFGVEFAEPYKVKQNNTIAYRSKTYQEFNEYYKMFYRGRKKIIRRKVLNLFEPIALAVWIQDDGSMCQNENIVRLHTECFSDKEQKMICKYFATIWHITAKINWVSKEKNLKCITFGTNGTRKLIDIIKPFIVPSMEYKIKLVNRLSKSEVLDRLTQGGIKTRWKKNDERLLGNKWNIGCIPWNKKFS